MSLYSETQMFLVMDTAALPEHIKQTFKLHPNAHGWESDLSGIAVGVEGQDILMSAAGYVVVYANNDWHRKKALELYDQIHALRQDAILLGIPVEVEVSATPLFVVEPFSGFNFTVTP